MTTQKQTQLPVHIIYRDGIGKQVGTIKSLNNKQVVQRLLARYHEKFIDDSLCEHCDSPLGVFIVENGHVNINY